jgi:hypothetical protein
MTIRIVEVLENRSRVKRKYLRSMRIVEVLDNHVLKGHSGKA